MNTSIPSELEQIREKGLYRRLEKHDGIDFCSNDFLGLSQSDSIRQILLKYLTSGGPLGSTGSRLVSGNDFRIEAAEELLATVFEAPSALFFGSGYLANLGVTQALANSQCEFFSDEQNHASLIDGMRLTKCRTHIFRHNDLRHLDELLRASGAERKVIVTESIFSMDGDGPDLSDLKKVCDSQGAFLILDEAHATGVLGSRGLGAAEGVGFDRERSVFVHTCGKALGGYGAFVTTSKSLRDLLINRARSFIYSTAPTPLQTVQTLAALDEIRSKPELRTSLHNNIQFLSKELSQTGILNSPSHIQSIVVPGNEKVLKAAQILLKHGLNVRAIRYPTVGKGKERLRITLKSFHSRNDLLHLVNGLKGVLA